MTREATRNTQESILGKTIGFGNMSAGRALTGCVTGIDGLDWDANPKRFVFNKTSELKESPSVVGASL